MFTKPSVNQIESAYTGNAPALNARIKQEQQANNSIAPDLRKLLAWQDMTTDQRHIGIDQAMRSPMNPPTVAQNMQERAKQIMQARMMQAQQKAMAKDGLAGMVPRNTPQPKRQPEGLDQLPANVGESYAKGGIVAFTTGDQVIDPMLGTMQNNRPSEDDLTFLERIGLFNPANRRALEKLDAELRQREAAGLKKGDIERGRLPDPRANQFRIGDAKTQLEAAAAETPAIETPKQQRVNVDKAPLPGGLKDLLPTPDTEAMSMLKKDMRRNPEKEAADLQAKYLQEVGKKDLSIYDKMAEELKAQKERLNAPKTGYDATMEYLEQIAQGGGRTWMEAGAKGASAQRALQKERQAQQNALMEKILDIGAKKSEAEFGERKGLFEMTQAERKSVYDKAYDAAKAVNMSDDKAKELAQNAVIEREKMANQRQVANIGASASRSQIATIADRLLAADKTGKLTQAAALEQAARIIGTSSLAGTEVRNQAAYDKALEALEGSVLAITSRGNTPQAKAAKKEYDAKLQELKQRYGMDGGAGLNSLNPAAGPTSSNVRSQADAIISGGR